MTFWHKLIANEPADRRRLAGEAAENSAARRLLHAENVRPGFSQLQGRNFSSHRSFSQSGGALHSSCLVCVWCGKVIEENECLPSLFTHIELKVPSGSVLTTRASPVFKSSTSSWRFSRAIFPNRTEWDYMNHWSKSSVQIKTQIEPVCRRIKRVCSSIKLAWSRSPWLY